MRTNNNRVTEDIPSVMTGFWNEARLSELDFDEIEEIRAGTTCLMDYLHGICTIFALALHDLYGYPVYCLADPYEVEEYGNPALAEDYFPIIHDFCMIGDPFEEGTVYLDCRGAVNHLQLFLEEFRDFFDSFQLLPYSDENLDTVRDRYWKEIGTAVADAHYNNARGYILAHEDQFKL